MSHPASIDLDCKAPPFDQLRGIHRLASQRAGHAAGDHARHQLYVARDKRTRTNVLIKVLSKPGLVYEQDLTNEIATLSTVNRELPDSRYFPVLEDNGRLPDGRLYLTMSCFDEWPLAQSIGIERVPGKLVAHLMTAIEVAKALGELHGLRIWHVDLNPMNILCRWERSRPVIRIVDFESSYEAARHASGIYNPPATLGFTAPELARQAPDARADVFSLGAVLYTMIAGHQWTWATDVARCVEEDPEIDAELKRILVTAVHGDPGGRYPAVADFRGALSAYLEQIWPGRQ